MSIRDPQPPALISAFLTSESGAVTVDFVVITAAVVGLGLAALTAVSVGIEDLSGDMSAALSDDSTMMAGYIATLTAEERIGYTQWDVRTANQQLATYNNQVNNRSDAQMRNGHRTWSNRVGNPSYPHAQDLVDVFELAMDTRNVDPHAGY